MILASFWHIVGAVWFSFISIVLMGVILLQRGKGVGLSGAFGGSGGHTAFGAKTGDVMTWATVVGALVLLATAVGLNYLFVPPPVPGALPAPAAAIPASQPMTPAPMPASPAGTTAPHGSQAPGGAGAPAGGGKAPECTWRSEDTMFRAPGPTHAIYGADVG
jgi:preprotein translocase subunit SecG